MTGGRGQHLVFHVEVGIVESIFDTFELNRNLESRADTLAKYMLFFSNLILLHSFLCPSPPGFPHPKIGRVPPKSNCILFPRTLVLTIMATSAQDFKLAGAAAGFTLGFGVLTVWAAIKQTLAVKVPQRSVYIYMIWGEILANLGIGIIGWLFMEGIIPLGYSFFIPAFSRILLTCPCLIA